MSAVIGFALISGTALVLGLLADRTNVGAGLAAVVRGTLPTERGE